VLLTKDRLPKQETETRESERDVKGGQSDLHSTADVYQPQVTIVVVAVVYQAYGFYVDQWWDVDRVTSVQLRNDLRIGSVDLEVQ